MSRQPVEPDIVTTDKQEIEPNYWLPITIMVGAVMLAAWLAYLRAFLSAFVC